MILLIKNYFSKSKPAEDDKPTDSLPEIINNESSEEKANTFKKKIEF